MQTPKPWDRREDESSKAHAAFRHYLEMREERSLAAVGKALGKSEGLIERWSAKFEWRKRVRAFEESVNALAQEAELKTLALANVNWAKRMVEQRETEYQDAQALRAKAAEIIAEKKLRGTELLAVARTLCVASELERRAMNLPTSQVEHTGAMAISNSTVLVSFPDNHRDKPQPPAPTQIALESQPQVNTEATKS